MKATLVTLEGTLFSSDDVVHVQAPTTDGEVGIYNNHIDYLARLGRGSVKIDYRKDEEQKSELFTLADGVIEVKDNTVTLLASVAEPTGEEIREYNEEKLQEAKEHAAQSDIDDRARMRAQKLVAIEEARAKTFKRRN
jgi:ATP synthase F1 epsilon subunit